jgi:membrane protein implicated in regulation of membrane protease activity
MKNNDFVLALGVALGAFQWTHQVVPSALLGFAAFWISAKVRASPQEDTRYYRTAHFMGETGTEESPIPGSE